MSTEGQGNLLPYIFQVLYVLCFTRPRYQVSVYRTIGPLVFVKATKLGSEKLAAWQNEFGKVSSLAAWQNEIGKVSSMAVRLIKMVKLAT